MGYFVAPLEKPYNVDVLIQVYIYTRRNDFVHEDFTDYYNGLLEALTSLFGIELSEVLHGQTHRPFWGLFNSTVDSLLRITSPWSGYLEAGLLHSQLRDAGAHGERVYLASDAIADANVKSEISHREMLKSLFILTFGECNQTVTSEELRAAGFDDNGEPKISDYWDYV